MPVAISPVDGQLGTMLREFVFESRDEFPGLLVDRALASEVVVVLGNRQHAFPRNIPSTQDVLEKRDHIVRRLWSTERDHKNGVVVHAFGLRMSCAYLAKKSSLMSFGNEVRARSVSGKLSP